MVVQLIKIKEVVLKKQVSQDKLDVDGGPVFSLIPLTQSRVTVAI
jgi:hypothetical protein